MGRTAIRIGRIAIFTIGVITLLVSAFWLPWHAGETARAFPSLAYLQSPLLLCVYLTLFPFSYALHEADRLLSRVEEGKSRASSLDRSLMHIAGAFLLTGVIYLSACAVLMSTGFDVPPAIWKSVTQPMVGAFLLALFVGLARRYSMKKEGHDVMAETRKRA